MTTTEASRQEIQAAIAKSMELRAIHAALLQSNSPSHLRLPAASALALPRHGSQHSARDYPVFTPSYDDVARNQTSPTCWDDYSLNVRRHDDLRFLSDYKNLNTSSRISLPPELTTTSKSKRYGPGNSTENRKYSSSVVPMTDSRSSVQSHSKPKSGKSLSWLFPRLNKKKPISREDNEGSIRGSGMVSLEALKKELTEANERRDAALMEVSEMKSAIDGLQEKMECLENYNEELKKALDQALLHTKGSDDSEGKPVDSKSDITPVSDEVMVEAFVQMVSEARSSVEHFCRALVAQMDEGDAVLLENLNPILQPHKLCSNSKHSKVSLHHLEAVINQSLYQDFENCVFRKNGSSKLLDPRQEREARFSLFCALRTLSWNEVLRKGTKYYSEEFSRFCDQKMSGIVTSLNWTRNWPEQLLQAFFVAAKSIWLLHLLAFSFSPALRILRVGENRSFDGVYMEDVFAGQLRDQNPTRVKVMVMPGFYMQDRVLRCKVLCRYRSAAG